MKILIYEDNQDELKVLEDCLREFFAQRHVKCEIHAYQESWRIYYELDDCDVVFLDIEGMNENGIDVGVRVRSRNKEVRIIFITNYSQYLIQGYKASANRYLLKPINKKEFMMEFESAIHDYLEKYQGFVDLTIYPKKIYYQNVMYIQYEDRKTWIYLNNGRRVPTDYPLKYWIAKLDGMLFAQTYKSSIVNIRYVKSYDRWNVYLKNGQDVPLSRNYKKGLEEMYYENIRRHL